SCAGSSRSDSRQAVLGRWFPGCFATRIGAPTKGGPMRSRFVIPAACVLLLGCGGVSSDPKTARSSSITYGSIDGNAHPAVGLLVMDIGGQPAFRCSGTFIAPKVF